ncbi:hypothetical protein DYB36_012374 [Aphanomyces astaci]|nr:hypothetical protein DYB36_012374 [Aphanomyces astaci]
MLKDAGRDAVVTDLLTPVVVRGFVGPSHTVTQEVKLTLKFETDVGSLVLANVKCWLSVGNLPTGVGDILLSRPIMHRLGYDPQSMLREAAAVCSEYDMEDVESTSGVVRAVMLATKQELVDDLAAEEEALVPMELAACFPDMTPVDPAVEQAKPEVIQTQTPPTGTTVSYGVNAGIPGQRPPDNPADSLRPQNDENSFFCRLSAQSQRAPSSG